MPGNIGQIKKNKTDFFILLAEPVENEIRTKESPILI